MQVKVVALFCLIQTSIGPDGLGASPFSVFSVRVTSFLSSELAWAENPATRLSYPSGL
jgi:hypothetical protein